MSRVPLIKSLKILLCTGIVGFGIATLLLPYPTTDNPLWLLLFFGTDFLLIISGPVATFILMFPPLPYLAVLFIVQGLLFAWWLYYVRAETASLVKLGIPIVLWVCIGTVSTILGLGAGV